MGVLDQLRRAIAPTSDAAAEYRCPDCSRTFAYAGDVSEPTCPYCDAEDLTEL